MPGLCSRRVPARSSFIAAPGRGGAMATKQVRKLGPYRNEDISRESSIKVKFMIVIEF